MDEVRRRSERECSELALRLQTLKTEHSEAKSQLDHRLSENAARRAKYDLAVAEFHAQTKQYEAAHSAHWYAGRNMDNQVQELKAKRNTIAQQVKAQREKYQWQNEVRASGHRYYSDPRSVGPLLERSAKLQQEIQKLEQLSAEPFTLTRPKFPAGPGMEPTSQLADQEAKLVRKVQCCERLLRMEEQRVRYHQYAIMFSLVVLSDDNVVFHPLNLAQFEDRLYVEVLECLMVTCNLHHQSQLLGRKKFDVQLQRMRPDFDWADPAIFSIDSSQPLGQQKQNPWRLNLFFCACSSAAAQS